VIGGCSIQVSNLGRVKLPRLIPKYGSIDLNGYAIVCINHGTYKVHRLVCVAFHGGSLDSELVVTHKDENKENNCASNLEWGTDAANKAYSLSKIVLQYKDGSVLAEFPSAAEASRVLDINATQIRACCTGNTQTAGGYEWKYKCYDIPATTTACGKPVIKIGTPDTVYESITAAARDIGL
jgi:3D (Asp-Asp-Asp) domain-containing protein